MSKAMFVRTTAGLAPADDSGKEALHGVAIGSIVMCEVSRPRNLRHLRLYWALCGSIADSIGAQRENVSDVIKLRTGHYTTVRTKSEFLRFPKSISFSALNQAEFSAFFEQACRVVCEEFLPHMTPSGLRSEIEQMVGMGAIAHAEA